MMIKAYLVADLAYGDCGKGSVVDFLVRETGAKLVVRYNGGPQCAHNVVTPHDCHHTFSQLGSGSFAGASTYLSQFMLIEPRSFLKERSLFVAKAGRPVEVFVERGARIITPYDWIANRAFANSGETCGWGVGEAREREVKGECVLTVGDLSSGYVVADKLARIREIKYEKMANCGVPIPMFDETKVYQLLANYREFRHSVNVVPDGCLTELKSMAPFVFEGAQGMLLDEKYGLLPYNTWTNITFENAEALLNGINAEVTKIGVLRSYFTRHGAGPFPTETNEERLRAGDHNIQFIPWLAESIGYRTRKTEGRWQGKFRVGTFDAVAARYALKCIGGVDYIALSHLDVTGREFPVCTSYLDGENGAKQVREIEKLSAGYMPATSRPCTPEQLGDLLEVPIWIESSGPTAKDKVWSHRKVSV